MILNGRKKKKQNWGDQDFCTSVNYSEKKCVTIENLKTSSFPWNASGHREDGVLQALFTSLSLGLHRSFSG